MKRNFLQTLLFAVIVPFYLSCENKVDNPVKPDTPETPTITEDINVEVNANTDNPLALSIKTIEGDIVHLYAQKDEDGNPISLSETVFNMADGAACDICFDENGMPTLIEAPDGVKFYIEWISESLAAVTIVDPVTGDQVNTYVDLEGNETPSEASARLMTRTVTPRSGEAYMEIVTVEESHKVRANPITRAEITSSTIPVKLKLRNCETLVDGQCYVDVYEQGTDGKFVTKCPGKKISKGIYEVQIPKSIFSEEDYKAYMGAGTGCEKVVKFMHLVCEGKGYVHAASLIVGTITLAATKYPGWAVAAAGGVEKVVDWYCDVLDARFAEMGCDKIKDMKQSDILYNSSHVKLVPYVLAMPYNIYGYPVNVDLSMPINDMEVSWGGSPSINSFTLNPPAPLHGVSYDAIAVLYCIPAGSTIYMNITGTDGYYNEKTETVSSTTNNYTATLHVPGAQTGVNDVCKVVVTTPDGKQYPKTASLTFQ